MAELSEKTIKRLFALSGNICAFPGCTTPIVESGGTVTGEICHITARSAGGPRFDPAMSEKDRHGFENLVLLCRRHHKVIDSEPDLYTQDALLEMKSVHEKQAGRPEQEQDGFFAKVLINDTRKVVVTNNSGYVAIDSPGTIQAQCVNVRPSTKKVTIGATAGTIGADQQASRYVHYLIERYNKFASSDSTRRTRFHFGAISKNIADNFGSKWQLLPLEKSQAVFEYLQFRINKTRLARINKGKGEKSFSSYQEFSAKHES